jgi:hypothetical protein
VPVCIDPQRGPRSGRPIAAMEKTRIDDPALDIPAVCEHLWQVIGNLGIARNRALIVPCAQALHHVLPDLVPWTAHGPGCSFSGQQQQPRTRRRRPSPRTFTGLAQVARDVKPAKFTGKAGVPAGPRFWTTRSSVTSCSTRSHV